MALKCRSIFHEKNYQFLKGLFFPSNRNVYCDLIKLPQNFELLREKKLKSFTEISLNNQIIFTLFTWFFLVFYRMCKWRTMPWRRLWTKFKVNWTHHWMRKNRNVKFWTLLPDNSATICILWVHFITNLLQCSILNEKRRYCRWFYSLQCYRKLIISLLLLHDFFLGKRTTFYFMCNLRIPTTDLMFLFMTKKDKSLFKIA